jgi:hypothetical protein
MATAGPAIECNCRNYGCNHVLLSECKELLSIQKLLCGFEDDVNMFISHLVVCILECLEFSDAKFCELVQAFERSLNEHGPKFCVSPTFQIHGLFSSNSMHKKGKLPADCCTNSRHECRCGKKDIYFHGRDSDCVVMCMYITRVVDLVKINLKDKFNHDCVIHYDLLENYIYKTFSMFILHKK